MIRTRFGGRVWRTRSVRSLFRKEFLCTFQISVSVICRNVMKTESFSIGLFKAIPIFSYLLKKSVCTDNIGLNKVIRSVNGTIHMALSREMHNNIGVVLM